MSYTTTACRCMHNIDFPWMWSKKKHMGFYCTLSIAGYYWILSSLPEVQRIFRFEPFALKLDGWHTEGLRNRKLSMCASSQLRDNALLRRCNIESHGNGVGDNPLSIKPGIHSHPSFVQVGTHHTFFLPHILNRPRVCRVPVKYLNTCWRSEKTLRLIRKLLFMNSYHSNFTYASERRKNTHSPTAHSIWCVKRESYNRESYNANVSIVTINMCHIKYRIMVECLCHWNHIVRLYAAFADTFLFFFQKHSINS